MFSKVTRTVAHFVSAEEWSDELTAEYRRELRARGDTPAAAGGQSVEVIFERAKAANARLPTAFIFALYVRACAELAGEGRRPSRDHDHKTDPALRLELGPSRIHVGFEGQVKVDWTDGHGEGRRNIDLQRDRSYRSPEERAGSRADDRSDLFSLTLSIAELFVLKRLSNGSTSISDSEGWNDFAELARSGTRLPRELGSLLLGSMAPNIEQRPLGVHSVLEELARIGRKNGLSAHRAAIASHMHHLFLTPSAPAAPRSVTPASRPRTWRPSRARGGRPFPARGANGGAQDR